MMEAGPAGIAKGGWSTMTFEEFELAFDRFKRLSGETQQRFFLSWDDRLPFLNDDTAAHGFDRHYAYHTAWAARVVAGIHPDYHVDFSSWLPFAAIVSAFVPVRFYDYRPACLHLDNMTSEHANLLALPFPDRSISSLSCMHVVEHIGLGRYGDPLDPDGDLKAIAELKRVIAPGGSLLFAVPIGKPRIMFNAHRIYAHAQVLSYFDGFVLKEFALIPEKPERGGLIRNASRDMADQEDYGCGCFWYLRPR
jgi:SAM-dependent methyltransferase